MGNCHNSSYNLGVPDQRFSHKNSLGCCSKKNWSQFFQCKLDKIDQKIADYVEKSRRKPHNFCTLKKLEKLKAIKSIIPSTFKPQPQTRFENDDLFMENLSKENELLMCEYCQKRVPSSTYKDHINECAQIFEAKNASLQENYKDSIQINEENSNEYLTTTCCYCSQKILLEYYDNHLDQCELNQINLNQRQDPKGRDSMLNNKSTQVRECAICLQTMKDDRNTKFLACAHQFHSDCIEDWYRKKKTCPVCQSDFS